MNKVNITLLLIVIEVYSWYVSLLCQTLEGRSQISNWISDILTYCPPCPNCDKFYTSGCSDSGSSETCAPLFDQIVQSLSVNQPWARFGPNDIQNIEVFMKFLVTEHCTHTYPDYMRNGEPLETVRHIDIQISQFDLKHVFLGFK